MPADLHKQRTTLPTLQNRPIRRVIAPGLVSGFIVYCIVFLLKKLVGPFIYVTMIYHNAALQPRKEELVTKIQFELFSVITIQQSFL